MSIMLFKIMLPLLERAGFLCIYCNGTDEEAPDLKEQGLRVKQALGKKATVITQPPERVWPLTPSPPSNAAALGPGIIGQVLKRRPPGKRSLTCPSAQGWVDEFFFFFFLEIARQGWRESRRKRLRPFPSAFP